MPGTLSRLEEKTSVILLTSPVCYSILYRVPSYSLLAVQGSRKENTGTTLTLRICFLLKIFPNYLVVEALQL